MHLRVAATIMSMALITHYNVIVATDFMYGAKDPFGPYPRIPDKEKLKKELEFAEECKKFITTHKDKFY